MDAHRLVRLRERLHWITENAELKDRWAHIEGLRTETGHSIELVKSEHNIERYTCCVHAFHLVEDPTYRDIAGFGLGRTFAGAKFIEFLLSNQLLAERQEDQARSDDLIMYFDDDHFKHVGKVINSGRILSKWGAGNLYAHDVWEIPVNYGGVVRFFDGPNDNQSLELFLKFAQSRGFTFEGR